MNCNAGLKKKKQKSSSSLFVNRIEGQKTSTYLVIYELRYVHFETIDFIATERALEHKN